MMTSGAQFGQLLSCHSLMSDTSSLEVGGLLHPIDVRPAIPEEAREGEPAYEYRLIAGQRRLEAYRRLQAQATTPEERSRWAKVPAILKVGVDAAEALEQAVIENIQREELSPLDEAEAYAGIKKKRGLKSAKEIASRVGKKEERVRRLLRLNEAPEVVKTALRTGLTVTVRAPAEAGFRRTPGAADPGAPPGLPGGARVR